MTGITAGLASAAPPSSIAEPIGEAGSKASFSFRVNAATTLLSNQPDGSTQIRIDGFPGHDARPGAPDLPFTVVRVAIPPGCTPRLVIDGVTEDRRPGVIPQAVPRIVATLDADAAEPADAGSEAHVRRERAFEPDPKIFKGTSLYPEQVARLGSIGVFRDQRYVEVVVTPARFDPLSNALRIARSVNLSVEFDDDTGARTHTAPDPRVEDLYRAMFVNYGQGTMFRIAPTSSIEPQALVQPDVAGPRYRIRVRANGMIRLDSSKLAGTGFETQPLSTYKLTNRGVEVPILVSDANGNDQLDAGDFIQFYGQALDDEPKTVLNTPIPTGTSIYELRDYSDENNYFLTAEAGARSRLPSLPQPSDLSTPVDKFGAIIHLETDNAWRPLGAADPWYWSPSQSNPPVTGSAVSRSQSVSLPNLATGTDPIEVIVRLRGMTEDAPTLPDHHSRVTLLNGSAQSLAVNTDDGSWDGRTIYTHDFTWTYPGSGALMSQPAQVTIDALAVAGSSGYKNSFILDFIELHYQRTFQATGDTLTFDYPDGDAEFQITGLTNVPEIWELTGRVSGSDVVAPVRMTGATVGGVAGSYSVRFHMTNDPTLPAGTSRRFTVTGAAGVATPAAADFTPDTVSDLRNTSNQADLIVIAHPTALGATATPILNSLLAWKLANQGITSKIAMIQDVYDEFNDGNASPLAIKNFLAFVMSTNPGEGWSGRKPAWVLLIGDGSYDSKYNDTTVPPSNFIPTQILFKDDPAFGYYASDSILADVVGGDVIPDLVVGRISTRTDAQSATVLQKVLNYEQNPPSGPWRNHSVFVSDRGKDYNPSEAQQWEDTNAAGAAFLKLPPNTQRTMRYWTDYCGLTQNGCTQPKADLLRSDIKKAINGTDGYSDGAAMAQYTGHGNFQVWSDDAFFAEGWNGYLDVGALTNGNKLPWLIVHNCLSAGFEDVNDVTLGEDWLKRTGGGSMAVFSPTGLNDSYWGFDITQKIWGSLFGGTKERVLGNAVATAMNYVCLYSQQNCQNYALLGDPTTRMVMTSVAPATNVVAVAGNATVSLTWSASATSGATYDVYRAVGQPTATYTRVNSVCVGGTAAGTPCVDNTPCSGGGVCTNTPLTATSYSDTTAQNAKIYYYYVVALDVNKFESRFSNFNSDCAVSGPDCVSAAPMNPNPPATPTGLTATDPETGGKLLLTWNLFTETDFDHYTVWWGTSPGVYTSSGNASKANSYTLAGLVNGTTYYIAVTATNTSSHTSSYSQERSGTPTFVRGVRAPDFISSLQISKSVSGTDAVLTWAPVTTDIYGKPSTIAYYEVFRGTTVGFIPSAANKIGQPTLPTFTDSNALSGAAPNYYYLVRGVDAAGNVGGLGNQLPNGIDTLTVTKTPDGAGGYILAFSWPAVTVNFDGEPLTIDHYEVYATNHPFSRSDIRNGLVPLLASPASASFSVSAPGTSQYYSVLAVDARGNKSSF